MAKKRSKQPLDPSLKALKQLSEELGTIKRLLIVLLLKIGTSQGEVAKALMTQQSEVSRLFPAKVVKKLKMAEVFDRDFWKATKQNLKS